jgi:hypothetical protein
LEVEPDTGAYQMLAEIATLVDDRIEKKPSPTKPEGSAPECDC